MVKTRLSTIEEVREHVTLLIDETQRTLDNIDDPYDPEFERACVELNLLICLNGMLNC